MVAKQSHEHFEIVSIPLDLINKFVCIMRLALSLLEEKTFDEKYIHELPTKFIANLVILKYSP